MQLIKTHYERILKLELNKYHIKKIKWTTRMAIGSLGILLFAIFMNEFREPLLGLKKGYAPHNFSFNFLFYFPFILTSVGLGLAVIGRTIKYWKTWTDLKKKLILIILSLPVVGFWIFLIARIFLTD